MLPINQINKINSRFESCISCGLPLKSCICVEVDVVETRAEVWILSTEKELYRPSNTARILKLCNPKKTHIFIWNRKYPPSELIEKLKDSRYEIYLVYPLEEGLCNPQVEYKKCDKIPVFLLIDGTWKEARRIRKNSDYLQGLPILPLQTQKESTYTLRKGAGEDNLCTLEAAVKTLELAGEEGAIHCILEGYQKFLKQYVSGPRA